MALLTESAVSHLVMSEFKYLYILAVLFADPQESLRILQVYQFIAFRSCPLEFIYIICFIVQMFST